MPAIRRLLIANRGEIVVRIARTTRRLGIETVAVASDADANAPHTRATDRLVMIGGESAGDSYLLATKLVAAAQSAGADGVHPGYGFLSEKAEFADAVRAAGLTWIGPPAAAMRALGDKAAARRHAISLGLPVVAGYDGAAQDGDALAREARRIGYPVLIKASAGGGGRGMRVVTDPGSLSDALAGAAAEARAAFDDARLVLERFVSAARHVEIQVFADSRGAVIHLGERDCSVQRRHQKLIEEAPSPVVSPELRRRMGEAAVTLAREVCYEGAGTVEFLLEPDGNFFFIEMNTRLQVEHAVTEALIGVDLVEWQLRVAAGEALPLGQDEALARFEAGGHAIEARLCAEDPAEGNLPQAGRVVRWREPPVVRCDHALENGTTVSAFYDSMLAKLVAQAPARTAAVAMLAQALDRTECLGVMTNRAFLARVLRHPEFDRGAVGTDFLDRHFASATSRAPDRSSALEALAAAASALLPRAPLPPLWRGWSSSPVVDDDVPIESAGATRTWRLTGTRADFVARSGDSSHRIAELRLHVLDASGGEVDAVVDGKPLRAAYARDGEATWWLADGVELAAVEGRLRTRAGESRARDDALLAPMHGRVTRVVAELGASVDRGALLVVIEAMKMEHEIRAPHQGVVIAMHARSGAQVTARQRLVEMAFSKVAAGAATTAVSSPAQAPQQDAQQQTAGGLCP